MQHRSLSVKHREIAREIIAKTYQCDDVSERDEQRDHFQNLHFCRVARVGRRVVVWIGTRFS